MTASTLLVALLTAASVIIVAVAFSQVRRAAAAGAVDRSASEPEAVTRERSPLTAASAAASAAGEQRARPVDPEPARLPVQAPEEMRDRDPDHDGARELRGGEHRGALVDEEPAPVVDEEPVRRDEITKREADDERAVAFGDGEHRDALVDDEPAPVVDEEPVQPHDVITRRQIDADDAVEFSDAPSFPQTTSPDLSTDATGRSAPMKSSRPFDREYLEQHEAYLVGEPDVDEQPALPVDEEPVTTERSSAMSNVTVSESDQVEKREDGAPYLQVGHEVNGILIAAEHAAAEIRAKAMRDAEAVKTAAEQHASAMRAEADARRADATTYSERHRAEAHAYAKDVCRRADETSARTIAEGEERARLIVSDATQKAAELEAEGRRRREELSQASAEAEKRIASMLAAFRTITGELQVFVPQEQLEPEAVAAADQSLEEPLEETVRRVSDPARKRAADSNGEPASPPEKPHRRSDGAGSARSESGSARSESGSGRSESGVQRTQTDEPSE